MKTKFLILIFSTLIGLYSCSESSIENPIHDNDTNLNNMLKFNNYADFIHLWNTITSNETTGIDLLKDQFNYTSFAEEADEFYDNIDWDSFNTSEEIIDFINENRKYFSISHDDEGAMVVEPVVSNNFMRMFMNEDRLFQIGDSVFKVCEIVTVGTNLSDIQVLSGINEENVSQAIANGDVFIFSEYGRSQQLKDWYYHCGFQASDKEDNVNERVRMEITVVYVIGISGGIPVMNEWTHLSIKGYRRRLGLWFNVARTITCDVKVATGYFCWNSSTWVRKIGTHATNGHFTRHLSRILTQKWTALGGNFLPISHFDGFNCWGKIPATSKAELKCNEHLVN